MSTNTVSFAMKHAVLCNTRSVQIEENTAYRILTLFALDRQSLSVSQILKIMKRDGIGWPLTTGAKIYYRNSYGWALPYFVSGYDHTGIDVLTAVLAW